MGVKALPGAGAAPGPTAQAGPTTQEIQQALTQIWAAEAHVQSLYDALGAKIPQGVTVLEYPGATTAVRSRRGKLVQEQVYYLSAAPPPVPNTGPPAGGGGP